MNITASINLGHRTVSTGSGTAAVGDYHKSLLLWPPALLRRSAFKDYFIWWTLILARGGKLYEQKKEICLEKVENIRKWIKKGKIIVFRTPCICNDKSKSVHTWVCTLNLASEKNLTNLTKDGSKWFIPQPKALTKHSTTSRLLKLTDNL